MVASGSFKLPCFIFCWDLAFNTCCKGTFKHFAQVCDHTQGSKTVNPHPEQKLLTVLSHYKARRAIFKAHFCKGSIQSSPCLFLQSHTSHHMHSTLCLNPPFLLVEIPFQSRLDQLTAYGQSRITLTSNERIRGLSRCIFLLDVSRNVPHCMCIQ